jgi:hypothetical protein
LVDGPLGIELGSDVGTADAMDGDAGRDQRGLKIPQGLLAGTQNDMIHFEHASFCLHGDVQSTIVDAIVRHAGEHFDAM